ncbi:MAG: hypothetical protein ACLSHC_08755 [Bilophila wadsworthia]
MVLFTDAEHVWQGGLSINRIVYCASSLLPDLDLPQAAPSAGREPYRKWKPAQPASLSFVEALAIWPANCRI